MHERWMDEQQTDEWRMREQRKRVVFGIVSGALIGAPASLVLFVSLTVWMQPSFTVGTSMHGALAVFMVLALTAVIGIVIGVKALRRP